MFCPACGKPLLINELALSRDKEKEFVCSNHHSWFLLLDDVEGDQSTLQPILLADAWDAEFWEPLIPNATIVQLFADLRGFNVTC